MKPEAFIPSIIRHYDRPKPWFEWLSGSVLFADISGFTSMSEKLSVLGAEGAEIMNRILNRYFARMIRIVQSFDGHVMKFAGDSIFCFFPGANDLNAPRRALQEMQTAARRFTNVRTPVGNFHLKMKIGLSKGEVLIGAVGDPQIRCDFLFAGAAVDRACQIQTAGTVEKVLNPADSKQNNSQTHIHFPHSKHATTRELSSFLIHEIYEGIQQGYSESISGLLRVVPVFLHFSGFHYARDSFEPSLFDEFFRSVVEMAHQQGGRLNAVTTGDKGSNLFLQFGAPNSLERKEELAAQFAVDVRDMIRSRFPGINVKIGMTEGRVFSGIVGGSGAFAYTVVGDPVNLAARLMEKAEDFEILVSDSFHQRNILFESVHRGIQNFKGKSTPINVFALTGHKKKISVEANSGRVLGRDSEIRLLREHLEEARLGKPHALFIEAEAGAGKSYLSNYFCQFARQIGCSVFVGKSEITRRSHAYTPWKLLISSMLFEGKTPTLEMLKKTLRHKNLLKFLSLHAEFLGIDCPKSTIRYDENTTKTLLHHQLATLLCQKIGTTPTVLFLDDLHWFDSLSLDFLSTLINHFDNQKILIIAASRPGWKKDAFLQRDHCRFLKLRPLKRSGLKKMLEFQLAGKIRAPLLDYFSDQTQGNPFLVSHLVDYLRSQNYLIQVDEQWTIKREDSYQKSFSGEEMIVAKVDQLDLPEKIHLRTAACMGPTFSIRVLQKALGKAFQKSAYESLRRENYFQELNDHQTSFSHALIQEAVYHSLPENFRSKTHKQIGRAMEQEFAGNLKSFYPNLANHFRLAGMKKEAIDYSLQAGDRLYSRFSFPESCAFYSHAHHLMKRSSDSRKWETALKLAENLIHTGAMTESAQLSSRLRNLCRKANLRSYYLKASLLQFDVMRRVSNYSYLPFALRLAVRFKRNRSFQAQIQHLIGSTYFWLGRPKEAELHLRKALQAQIKDTNWEAKLSSYYFLFTIAADRKNLRKANRLMQIALKMAARSGNLFQEIRIRQEWAGILADNNQPQKAKNILLQLLPRAEAFGDFYLVAVLLVGLGQAVCKLGNYEKAEKYLEEAIRLFSSLGVAHGKSKATMWLGIVYFYQNQLQKAYDSYLEATTRFQQVGEIQEASLGYFNLAEVCIKLGRTIESKKWIETGLKSLQSRKDPDLLGMFEDLKSQLNCSLDSPPSRSGHSLDNNS